MNTPEFLPSRILQLIAGIAHKWGGPEKVREIAATLRAVPDPEQYLRRVADLGPVAAEQLVVAAILGVTIAATTADLVDPNSSLSHPQGG